MLATGSVLHVDDRAEDRKLFYEILEENGYTVLSAPSAAEARKLDLNGVEIAFVDSCGIELADELAGSESACTVVMLSASSATSHPNISRVISKAEDWEEHVLQVIAEKIGEESLERRQALKIGGDVAEWEKLRGRTAVLSGTPEQILKVFDNYHDALEYARDRGPACRVVSGPPACDPEFERELLSLSATQ